MINSRVTPIVPKHLITEAEEKYFQEHGAWHILGVQLGAELPLNRLSLPDRHPGTRSGLLEDSYWNQPAPLLFSCMSKDVGNPVQIPLEVAVRFSRKPLKGQMIKNPRTHLWRRLAHGMTAA